MLPACESLPVGETYTSHGPAKGVGGGVGAGGGVGEGGFGVGFGVGESGQQFSLPIADLFVAQFLALRN